MRAVLWGLLLTSIIGFFLSVIIEGGYTARAQRFQFVHIDSTKASKFGPGVEEIGEPVELCLADNGALVNGKTAVGLARLNTDYLNAHPGAAVRLDAVQKAGNFARLGCTASLLFALLGFALLRRFQALLQPMTPEDLENLTR